jgi:uncharacterized protein (DUF111 family)
VLLSVQAAPATADALEAILFQETTTLGVRRQQVERSVLAREAAEVTTPWGPIAGKIVHLPNGTRRFAPEYEACHRVALDQKLSLAAVIATAKQAFELGST